LICISLSAPPSMKAPRASSGLLVYHNLDPDCHIGPASMRTLHASHVSNPVVISKEKAKSYLMRRSNSSPHQSAECHLL
jgi:hypothetical protein